jgi:hypothetical protein
MDTIRNDSIDIILHEEVYKNELKRAKVSYKWKAPTMQIKETITNNIYPNTLHIGGVVSYYYKLPSLGLYGSYETKKMGFGLIIDPFAKGGSIIVSKRFNFKR